jgi:ActR/RegA family two-component response regulator
MYHQMLVEDAKTVLLIEAAGYAERLSAPLARSTGAHIVTATDLTSALRAIERDKPQAVISGLPLTDEVGLPLLFYVSVHHPGLPVVVLLDEATDDMVQQAQWYGATTSLVRCADPGALSASVSAALGMSSPFAVWDRVAEVAARRHLSLVLPTPVSQFDADARLGGLFRGLGEVRGLRGTIALDEDGSALSMIDTTGSLDVPGIVATLHGLIQASHSACTGAGLEEFETAVLRTGRETIVMSCCADESTHVHVVTLVAPDGNRALVELAHKRLQREFHEVQAAGGYPATLASAAEISA